MVTVERLTGAFDSGCLRGVKSQSPHGEGVFADLTDLTDILSYYTRLRVVASTRPRLYAHIASENFGQIGQIAIRPLVVCGFSFDRLGANRGNTGVKSGWFA